MSKNEEKNYSFRVVIEALPNTLFRVDLDNDNIVFILFIGKNENE